jgi:hypothetical protein
VEEELDTLEEIKQCCSKVLATLSHVLAPALRIVTLELMEPLSSLATVRCGCNQPATLHETERRHLVAQTLFELAHHDEPLLRQLLVEEGAIPVLNLLAVPDVLEEGLMAAAEAQAERAATRKEREERARAAETKIKEKDAEDKARRRRRKEVTQHHTAKAAEKGGALSGLLGHAMVGGDTDSDEEGGLSTGHDHTGGDDDAQEARAETPLKALYNDEENELIERVEGEGGEEDAKGGGGSPARRERKAQKHGETGVKLELAMRSREHRLKTEAQHANVASVPVLVAGTLAYLATVPGVRVSMLGDGCMRSMASICVRGLRDINTIYEVAILDTGGGQSQQVQLNPLTGRAVLYDDDEDGGGDAARIVPGIERLARAMGGVARTLHELVETKNVAIEAAKEGGLDVLTQLMTAGMDVRRLMADQQQKVARSKMRSTRLADESTKVRREAMALREAAEAMAERARVEKDAIVSEPLAKQAEAMTKRSSALVHESARLGNSMAEEEQNLSRQKQRLQRLEDELEVEATRTATTSALFRLVSHAVPGAIPHLQELVVGRGATPATWRLCAHALLDLARHGTAASRGGDVRSSSSDDGDDGEGKSPTVGVPAVHILSLLAARPDDQTRVWAAEALLELSRVRGPDHFLARCLALPRVASRCLALPRVASRCLASR